MPKINNYVAQSNYVALESDLDVSIRGLTFRRLRASLKPVSHQNKNYNLEKTLPTYSEDVCENPGFPGLIGCSLV